MVVRGLKVSEEDCLRLAELTYVEWNSMVSRLAAKWGGRTPAFRLRVSVYAQIRRTLNAK